MKRISTEIDQLVAVFREQAGFARTSSSFFFRIVDKPLSRRKGKGQFRKSLRFPFHPPDAQADGGRWQFIAFLEGSISLKACFLLKRTGFAMKKAAEAAS